MPAKPAGPNDPWPCTACTLINSAFLDANRSIRRTTCDACGAKREESWKASSSSSATSSSASAAVAEPPVVGPGSSISAPAIMNLDSFGYGGRVTVTPAAPPEGGGKGKKERGVGKWEETTSGPKKLTKAEQKKAAALAAEEAKRINPLPYKAKADAEAKQRELEARRAASEAAAAAELEARKSDMDHDALVAPARRLTDQERRAAQLAKRLAAADGRSSPPPAAGGSAAPTSSGSGSASPPVVGAAAPSSSPSAPAAKALHPLNPTAPVLPPVPTAAVELKSNFPLNPVLAAAAPLGSPPGGRTSGTSTKVVVRPAHAPSVTSAASTSAPHAAAAAAAAAASVASSLPPPSVEAMLDPGTTTLRTQLHGKFKDVSSSSGGGKEGKGSKASSSSATTPKPASVAESGPWNCSTCLSVNEEGNAVCDICQLPRPSGDAQAPILALGASVAAKEKSAAAAAAPLATSGVPSAAPASSSKAAAASSSSALPVFDEEGEEEENEKDEEAAEPVPAKASLSSLPKPASSSPPAPAVTPKPAPAPPRMTIGGLVSLNEEGDDEEDDEDDAEETTPPVQAAPLQKQQQAAAAVSSKQAQAALPAVSPPASGGKPPAAPSSSSSSVVSAPSKQQQPPQQQKRASSSSPAPPKAPEEEEDDVLAIARQLEEEEKEKQRQQKAKQQQQSSASAAGSKAGKQARGSGAVGSNSPSTPSLTSTASSAPPPPSLPLLGEDPFKFEEGSSSSSSSSSSAAPDAPSSSSSSASALLPPGVGPFAAAKLEAITVPLISEEDVSLLAKQPLTSVLRHLADELSRNNSPQATALGFELASRHSSVPKKGNARANMTKGLTHLQAERVALARLWLSLRRRLPKAALAPLSADSPTMRHSPDVVHPLDVIVSTTLRLLAGHASLLVDISNSVRESTVAVMQKGGKQRPTQADPGVMQSASIFAHLDKLAMLCAGDELKPLVNATEQPEIIRVAVTENAYALGASLLKHVDDVQGFLTGAKDRDAALNFDLGKSSPYRVAAASVASFFKRLCGVEPHLHVAGAVLARELDLKMEAAAAVSSSISSTGGRKQASSKGAASPSPAASSSRGTTNSSSSSSAVSVTSSPAELQMWSAQRSVSAHSAHASFTAATGGVTFSSFRIALASQLRRLGSLPSAPHPLDTIGPQDLDAALQFTTQRFAAAAAVVRSVCRLLGAFTPPSSALAPSLWPLHLSLLRLCADFMACHVETTTLLHRSSRTSGSDSGDDDVSASGSGSGLAPVLQLNKDAMDAVQALQRTLFDALQARAADLALSFAAHCSPASSGSGGRGSVATLAVWDPLAPLLRQALEVVTAMQQQHKLTTDKDDESSLLRPLAGDMTGTRLLKTRPYLWSENLSSPESSAALRRLWMETAALADLLNWNSTAFAHAFRTAKQALYPSMPSASAALALVQVAILTPLYLFTHCHLIHRPAAYLAEIRRVLTERGVLLPSSSLPALPSKPRHTLLQPLPPPSVKGHALFISVMSAVVDLLERHGEVRKPFQRPLPLADAAAAPGNEDERDEEEEGFGYAGPSPLTPPEVPWVVARLQMRRLFVSLLTSVAEKRPDVSPPYWTLPPPSPDASSAPATPLAPSPTAAAASAASTAVQAPFLSHMSTFLVLNVGVSRSLVADEGLEGARRLLSSFFICPPLSGKELTVEERTPAVLALERVAVDPAGAADLYAAVLRFSLKVGMVSSKPVVNGFDGRTSPSLPGDYRLPARISTLPMSHSALFPAIVACERAHWAAWLDTAPCTSSIALPSSSTSASSPDSSGSPLTIGFGCPLPDDAPLVRHSRGEEVPPEQLSGSSSGSAASAASSSSSSPVSPHSGSGVSGVPSYPPLPTAAGGLTLQLSQLYKRGTSRVALEQALDYLHARRACGTDSASVLSELDARCGIVTQHRAPSSSDDAKVPLTTVGATGVSVCRGHLDDPRLPSQWYTLLAFRGVPAVDNDSRLILHRAVSGLSVASLAASSKTASLTAEDAKKVLDPFFRASGISGVLQQDAVIVSNAVTLPPSAMGRGDAVASDAGPRLDVVLCLGQLVNATRLLTSRGVNQLACAPYRIDAPSVSWFSPARAYVAVPLTGTSGGAAVTSGPPLFDVPPPASPPPGSSSPGAAAADDVSGSSFDPHAACAVFPELPSSPSSGASAAAGYSSALLSALTSPGWIDTEAEAAEWFGDRSASTTASSSSAAGSKGGDNAEEEDDDNDVRGPTGSREGGASADAALQPFLRFISAHTASRAAKRPQQQQRGKQQQQASTGIQVPSPYFEGAARSVLLKSTSTGTSAGGGVSISTPTTAAAAAAMPPSASLYSSLDSTPEFESILSALSTSGPALGIAGSIRAQNMVADATRQLLLQQGQAQPSAASAGPLRRGLSAAIASGGPGRASYEPTPYGVSPLVAATSVARAGTTGSAVVSSSASVSPGDRIPGLGQILERHPSASSISASSSSAAGGVPHASVAAPASSSSASVASYVRSGLDSPLSANARRPLPPTTAASVGLNTNEPAMWFRPGASAAGGNIAGAAGGVQGGGLFSAAGWFPETKSNAAMRRAHEESRANARLLGRDDDDDEDDDDDDEENEDGSEQEEQEEVSYEQIRAASSRASSAYTSAHSSSRHSASSPSASASGGLPGASASGGLPGASSATASRGSAAAFSAEEAEGDEEENKCNDVTPSDPAEAVRQRVEVMSLAERRLEALLTQQAKDSGAPGSSDVSSSSPRSLSATAIPAAAQRVKATSDEEWNEVLSESSAGSSPASSPDRTPPRPSANSAASSTSSSTPSPTRSAASATAALLASVSLEDDAAAAAAADATDVTVALQPDGADNCGENDKEQKRDDDEGGVDL